MREIHIQMHLKESRLNMASRIDQAMRRGEGRQEFMERGERGASGPTEQEQA